MQQYFPCHRCGTNNLVGVTVCGNCQQTLYYNCPHCGAWVDNRYSNCPGCHRVLKWPRAEGSNSGSGHTHYIPQTGYLRQNKGNPWPAILISMLIVGVLAFIITAHSSTGTAGNNSIANAILQTSQASTSPAVSQPQITVSSPSGPSSTPSFTPTYDGSNPADSSACLPEGVTMANTGCDDEGCQITPGMTTTGTGYTPKPSSYLQQLWPNWGHCSGGSCRSCSQ